MSRKRKISRPNHSLKILTLIFVAPFIVLKLIGDSIIFLIKSLLLFSFKAYKIFRFSLSLVIKIILLATYQLSKFINKITVRQIQFAKLFKQIKHRLMRYSLKRKKVIFPPPKHLTLPKLSPLPKMPGRLKLPKLPRSLRLFFLKIKFFFLGGLSVGIIASGYFVYTIVISLPNPKFLSLRDIPASTKIYDRNGKLLYEIYAEENRTPIKLVEIPEIVKQTTIAIEDKEFFTHRGFSFRGIIRALFHNLKSDNLEGGSTITQQLIRSVLLTPEKTLLRKIKEVVLATWAEQIYSKEQILEMYLNQVPYGGTAWGIEAAAQTYFGKDVKDLTLAEAALLAGLPASPTSFSPFGTHPELAKERQIEVLKGMVENGYISNKERQEAENQPLSFRHPATPILAPHFVMYVKELLEFQYGERLVEKGGLRVVTTLDLNLQEMTQKVVSDQIENLRHLNVGNGAALITDPKNGEILAMVGSADYFDKEKQGNVNVALSLRQPGSSIKVINYTAALTHGFTAASILDDLPISYRVVGQTPYAPVNYDGRFHGRISLRVALASSYNVPAVKVLNKIGLETMIEQGRLMGITTWEDTGRFGLSLTLGGGEVTMLDMAKVYGTLAGSGIRRDLTPIISVTNFHGEQLPPTTVKSEVQATSSGIAFILSSILSDNITRTPAFGPNSALVIPGKTVAVKTGTSDNKRDNWTIGYTPDYVVTVWVGNNNNAPMNPQLTSGVTGAAPIWHEIITNLLTDKEDKPFLPPEDVTSLPCYGRIEYFIRGTEPAGGCPRLVPTSNIPTPTP